MIITARDLGNDVRQNCIRIKTDKRIEGIATKNEIYLKRNTYSSRELIIIQVVARNTLVNSRSA
jgi:hypothetical protein